MATKRAALLAYPGLCLYEVMPLLALLGYEEKKVDIVGIDDKPIATEEGLRILPDVTMARFDPDACDALLLTGIGGIEPLANEAYTDFLHAFAGRDDILLAAISLAPVLLGKAGLLAGRKFCVGMYEEDKSSFPFFDYDNRVYGPLVEDGNVITAVGHAFREFAVAVMRRLGYACRDNVFAPVTYPVNPEDYVYRMKAEDA